MIRILIFLLLIVLVAGGVTFLSGIDSRIEAEAFGLKYSLHTGFIIGLVATILAGVMYFTSLTKDVIALPGKIRSKQREAKQERGMAALARGMESVLVGDAVDAQHHARIAKRNLEQSSLTRLLTAQAAQLAGDDGGARENFTLMLEAPETEFLGLHGLYAHAMRAGDQEAARRHAERAFKLRPNAQWAFDSVLELNLNRGAWGETREILKIAKANRLISDDEARRGEAALLTADAYAAGLSEDDETASKEAEAAFRLAHELTPAAILAASSLADRGKKSRAAKLLEQSFAAYPHPAISKLYEQVFAEDSDIKTATALQKLADKAPESHEAKFLFARVEALLGNHQRAVELLEPIITEQPFAREFSAVADAIGQLRDEEAARPWLERAARAQRNPEPGANGTFNFTRIGWARLVREFMDNARLAPPPLEDTIEALSQEDIKLLVAPIPEQPSVEEDEELSSLEVAEQVMAEAKDSSVESSVANDSKLESKAKEVASAT